MILRGYQEEAIDAIFDYFEKKNGNPIVALPTGTGKSLVIAAFIQRVLNTYRGTRIIVLTHVQELIAQNHAELLALWKTAPSGVYSSGLGRKDIGAQITFAGIASVNKKAKHFGIIDLVLIDECHLVSPHQSTMYRAFLDALRVANPLLKVIGLSATPYRLGLGCLTDGGLFTDICYDYTTPSAFQELIRDGYLSPLVTKRTLMQYDVSGVKTRGGEYIESELQAAVDRDSLSISAVREIVAVGAERKHWLIFTSGLSHMKHISKILTDNGIANGSVFSLMPSRDRDRAIRDFKAGKVRALLNNNILTTGFNFPAIDLIAVLRPTSSPVLWVQMLGRGTRVAPNKDNCLVLDFAGNTKRLGTIDEPMRPRRKKGSGNGDAPVRVCEGCSNYCHASLVVCPYCGFEFPRTTKISGVASYQEVMKQRLPLVENFSVDRVTYALHSKTGKPQSVQVTYFCGLRRFREWICFGHEGYARRKAVDWWHSRGGKDTPPDALEALRIIERDNIIAPVAINVWINKEHPEIVSAVFRK